MSFINETGQNCQKLLGIVGITTQWQLSEIIGADKLQGLVCACSSGGANYGISLLVAGSSVS